MRGTFLSPQTLYHKSQWQDYETMSSKPGVQISQWSSGWGVWDCSFTRANLGVCGKNRVIWERNFSHHKHYITNPNDGDMQKWVPNLMFKFYDNPMVKESDIVFLMGHVWVKEKILGTKEEKTNLRARESVETYRKYKIDLIYLYL